MAPGKFAFCRGLDVDLSFQGVEHRTTPYSYFNASHQHDEEEEQEAACEQEHYNYDDVFGGPPKLAGLSSFRRLFSTKRRGICAQFVHGTDCFRPNSRAGNANIDLNILRTLEGIKVSPRMCYSDNDRKIRAKCEEKQGCNVYEPSRTPVAAPILESKPKKTYFTKSASFVVREVYTRERSSQKHREGFGKCLPVEENINSDWYFHPKESYGKGSRKKIHSRKGVSVGLQDDLRHEVKSEGNVLLDDEIWMAVKDIKLATLPCKFPTPSRAPPYPVKCSAIKLEETYASHCQSSGSSVIEDSICISKASNVPSVASFKKLIEMDEAKLQSIEAASQKANRRVAKKVKDVEDVLWRKNYKCAQVEKQLSFARSDEDDFKKPVLEPFNVGQSSQYAESSSGFCMKNVKSREFGGSGGRTEIPSKRESRISDEKSTHVEDKDNFMDQHKLKEHSKSVTALDSMTSTDVDNDYRDIPPGYIGEMTQRMEARWEGHCQTLQPMSKALQEKHQHDLQIKREHAERERAGELLDSKIRQWAVGKEGNLRALLCNLQFLLWPECGWHPLSPSSVLDREALRQAYRKATLCLHPDKVQQRGATISQKYIAEKVFDLLKEASKSSL